MKANEYDVEYRCFIQDILWSLAITRDLSTDENIAKAIKIAFRVSELFWPEWEREQRRLAQAAEPAQPKPDLAKELQASLDALPAKELSAIGKAIADKTKAAAKKKARRR